MEYFGGSTRLFDHFVLISFRSYGGILSSPTFPLLATSHGEQRLLPGWDGCIPGNKPTASGKFLRYATQMWHFHLSAVQQHRMVRSARQQACVNYPPERLDPSAA